MEISPQLRKFEFVLVVKLFVKCLNYDSVCVYVNICNIIIDVYGRIGVNKSKYSSDLI